MKRIFGFLLCCACVLTTMAQEPAGESMDEIEKRVLMRIEMLKPRVEAGDPQAIEAQAFDEFQLGYGYALDNSYDLALPWLKASIGHEIDIPNSQFKEYFAIAEYVLGLIYDYGYGVEEDKVEALKWYKLGAEHGNEQAMCSLGYNYETGEGTAPDHEAAVYWYRQALAVGSANAAHNLGTFYAEGKGVKQDYAEAFRYFLQAAEGGYGDSFWNVGMFYYLGQGTKKNFKSAAQWFERAYDAGDADAAYVLGVLLYRGEGVQRDYDKAFKMMCEAELMGAEAAYSGLAECYYKGRGTAVDYSLARLYAEKALSVDTDDKEAKKILKRLGPDR